MLSYYGKKQMSMLYFANFLCYFYSNIPSKEIRFGNYASKVTVLFVDYITIKGFKTMKKSISKCIALLGAVSMVAGGCHVPRENTNTENAQAQIQVMPESGYAISEDLFGIFLEDINFAVDAGLYAELIKNRSFEYGSLAANKNLHGWTVIGESVSFSVADGSRDGTALNENNPNYAVLTNESNTPAGIFNTGYLDGITVNGGSSYTASLFARGTADLTLSLEDRDGKVYAQAEIAASSDGWHKYSVTLTPEKTLSEVRFVLRMGKGTLHVDMISLMPDDTYKGLPVRRDLGEALEALSPSFIRFPGGCAIEGKSLETMYSWKDSIGNAIAFTVNGENAVGDVATRPQTIDLWNGNARHPYYCTYGLGFFEYFRLCHEMGVMPIPILNAGMTCPIQSSKYIVYDMDSPEFKQCVQDALDLVEFCLGGADTKWGAVRIAMGQEEPFELKYIGIGNEQWQREYFEHYQAFEDAFRQARQDRPELFGSVELIVANGPASGSTEGWTFIKRNPDELTTLVDEHYYEPPAWFLANTKRYDTYDRNLSAKVFLGEYASQSNTMNSALAEAAFMTGLERNGDVVRLACYAPLFGNSTLSQWLPDMIFFKSDSHYLTPNYYVQQLFSANAGVAYYPTKVTVNAETAQKELTGKVGLGSWMTSVAYDDLKVVSADGTVLYENSFDSTDSLDAFDMHQGNWEVKDGRLVQKHTGSPADETTGDAVYVGDSSWGDYTMTVKARILTGAEGFLIPVCVKNSKNNIFWNLGGWGNTVSCLQTVAGGAKSGQVSGTVRSVKLKQNTDYELTVTVSGNNIKCYLDGILYINYTEEAADPLYASTVRDANGDVIVKIVNISKDPIAAAVNIPGIGSGYEKTAAVTVLQAEDPGQINDFSDPHNISPIESTLSVSESFLYEAPAYSVTVIRIPAK